MANDDKQFATFKRGQVRDDIVLASFRNSLRELVNPETGAVFTEDEIFRATQPGSRFYIEADAIDLLGTAKQAKSAFLANQLIPSRANSEWLEEFWGRLYLGKDSKLPATGGGGPMIARAPTGSIFPGSSTVGDPTAAIATDPNGYKYQVTETVAVTAEDNGEVALQMRAIDIGLETNISADTVLTWSSNAPISAESTGHASEDFSGGFNIETDAEYAGRIEERIRYRPAGGNAAHFTAWAKEATTAVESAFVYPCAMNAGSTMVAVLQKRGSKHGPLARVIPDATTTADVTRYLVPPNSPVVPERAFVVVVSPNPQPCDLVVRVTMGYGRNGGWYNNIPWPNPPSTETEENLQTKISSVFSQIYFRITTTLNLPGGASALTGEDAPQMMVWDAATSRFERLNVSAITKSGSIADVTLSSAPNHTLAVGDCLSPCTDQMDAVAEAAESYFDELGPGEVIDSANPLWERAARFPATYERYPVRAGQTIATRIVDALGNVSPDASLVWISRAEPDLPATGSIIDGPNQVVLGNLTVLPL